jgi:hypothetical protein
MSNFYDNLNLNGNLSINNSSTGNTLYINQLGSGNAVLIEDSISPDATPFIIDSSGNVNIGRVEYLETSGGDKAKLQVNNSTSTIPFSGLPFTTNFIVQGFNQNSVGLFTTDINHSQIYFGTPSDVFGSNIRWDYSNRLLNISTQNTGGTITLSTGENNETIRLLPNGYVGIGITTPTEQLDVSGNTKISGSLNIGTILSGTPIINLGLDSNGNVVTGTTGTFTGNTSGITNPSAINVIATDGTPTTSSGSLTPLISSQVLIPANTLSTNCVLEIVWTQFRVSGATGTIQSTIYISTTSGTLGSAPSVGSTLIATGPNLTSTNFSVLGRRDLNKQGVDGKIMNATGSFNSDGTPSGAITTFTIDNSNDVYLQFCTGSTGAGDTSNIRGVRVTQYKQL